MKAGLALLVALALAACGGERAEQGQGALVLPPGEPEAALAWVADVEDDPAELRKRLDVWPLGGEDFEFADETQIAFTWRLQLALRDRDLERAGILRDLLRERFEGRGQYPAGRGLGADAVRLAVLDEALLAARGRIEGVRPDLARARGALDVAARMLEEGDTEERARLEGTRTWVEATTAARMVEAVGATAAIGDRVQATLLVFADDFALGEGVFFEVLQQWRDNHAEARFDRLLIPLLRGQVRMGLRLVPAESEAAELAAIQQRCGEAGLSFERAVPVARLEALGLATGDAALVLADAEGRIVARLCGRSPDLRILEPALQRLLSR